MHTHAHVIRAQEAYLNADNFRVSPSVFWQLKAIIHFQDCFLYPKPLSICLFTLSCIFCLFGSRVTTSSGQI